MFSRSKTSTPDGVTPVGESPDEVTQAPSAAGKGRPTPKRNVAQAANKRPLVPDDRRAARKAQREKSRVDRERTYQAMQTGDERYMPPRDKGPVRRYVRDFVDARWNLGEFFLPVAFVFLFATFFTQRYPELSIVVMLGLYGFLLLTIVDVWLLWRSLKKRLTAKFGEVPRGLLMYTVTRAYQLRRSRLPKPMSKKRGNYPE
ncbi:DUF3043 domain-containing protein [Promicromonospora thailandica]|uniref:DUF3043 family protein n=1 Tax=Promicromonospora thailandica TaxID=765201 RepID=A0A9X2G2Y8_9MICO|nr:DUF3043 domain-containing protein [Promicromonospora thailandica]MCP2265934.1 Protein of unknown function (DUF3043) [Promicromonospora thailandica]BFF21493.1 DUF3043 domain-containing protein [Promicromonospora thailandica]